MNDTPTLSQRADALEEKMSRDLDLIVIKSRLYSLAEADFGPQPNANAIMAKNPNARVLMGDDPRLPKMPDQPTLADFFKYRVGPAAHLLQSASLAKRRGAPEETVLACLLHDIGGYLMKADHGYWGAQLIEPYVSEKVSFAVRQHQCLRFYADPETGYEYPVRYYEAFGFDYVPPPHIQAAYDYTRNHSWYMEARLVTMNDLYTFNPNVKVDIDEFREIIGRHFKTPKEGLGYDNSPVAHMWRTMINPDAPL